MAELLRRTARELANEWLLAHKIERYDVQGFEHCRYAVEIMGHNRELSGNDPLLWYSVVNDMVTEIFQKNIGE